MHIGKVMGSTAGWQVLKQRAMQGLTMFQEYVTGVFAFLNNFVCVDKSTCGMYHCREHYCHDAPSIHTSLQDPKNGTMKYLEDYSDEELIAMLNHTMYRPCNASEEFDRACLYDSSCIAYLLPDNVIELVCNCTPGWKGEQCELADMDGGELAIHIGGFQADFILLVVVYLLVDFCFGFYLSYHANRKNDKEDSLERKSRDWSHRSSRDRELSRNHRLVLLFECLKAKFVALWNGCFHGDELIK